MSLLIPKSFSTKTGSVQLSDLDTNFTYLTSTINTALDITGTAVTLANTLTVNGASGASVLLRNGGDLQLFNADNTGNVSLYCDTNGVLHVNSINVNTINVLTGAVSYFAMNAAPTGWLKANGAAISRTTYSSLFSAISTNFGVGDGSTTFNVPDLRGEFIRAWDDGRGVDSGRSFGSVQSEMINQHKHWISSMAVDDRNISTTGANSQEYGIVADAGTYSSDDPNKGTGRYTRNDPGFGTNNETRPRNISLLACIKF